MSQDLPRHLIGRFVKLGAHTPLDDGYRNFVPEMAQFVGTIAKVCGVRLEGFNGVPCVYVEGNSFHWRVKDLQAVLDEHGYESVDYGDDS